jgi:hypothetical protein
LPLAWKERPQLAGNGDVAVCEAVLA